ncbi:MAG: hypothetical protein UW46_C0001G0019 [Candidatus Yanofskybacteria bacterium GW2011_GWF1_44_227]|uniref:Uncharacterized protein n=1 Tax=Candidatus Yanofskybacteria bacterium GW2011_GWE2_40_11 TaxID=1619033 RepID=A0A0G0TSK1_9BACT|nr:MAG: hypothetical protein UT69_C0012G0031 [Candidatus Yanofskybacteria bacterium GW2011_GWE1_40_10]KKR40842.1 MAG: hypothetical protein UT75_C0004G0053 [Candidatus Yanofskybacteria bacterium GW2011_GWE2_40_11]KKT15957.1 MAG: hypothetical protein UV97_C0001G0130 [Candidatus Yanofskybacteria bacterium GW2011_GWF2_43_596]KKT53529.1 MAG: hypothetical protein UW46_C0001G0019 [Candidatus Yanofskybacteria bacterium GW2011_GWF1_44_227]OGN36053.1 MAG: hypothetical protein A2207_03275 [Candidatus Yano
MNLGLAGQSGCFFALSLLTKRQNKSISVISTAENLVGGNKTILRHLALREDVMGKLILGLVSALLLVFVLLTATCNSTCYALGDLIPRTTIDGVTPLETKIDFVYKVEPGEPIQIVEHDDDGTMRTLTFGTDGWCRGCENENPIRTDHLKRSIRVTSLDPARRNVRFTLREVRYRIGLFDSGWE